MILDGVFPTLDNHNVYISPSNVFFVLLIPIFVLSYIYWKLSRKHMIELAEKLPGPGGYPIIGNALDYVGSNVGKLIVI